MGCRIHLNHLARFAMCHVPCAMCHVPCAMCHVTDPALPFPAGSTATPLTFKGTGREDCRLGVKISLRSCPSRLPPSCVACTQHSGGCVSGGAYAECPQCRPLSCLPNCSFFWREFVASQPTHAGPGHPGVPASWIPSTRWVPSRG